MPTKKFFDKSAIVNMCNFIFVFGVREKDVQRKNRRIENNHKEEKKKWMEWIEQSGVGGWIVNNGSEDEERWKGRKQFIAIEALLWHSHAFGMLLLTTVNANGQI